MVGGAIPPLTLTASEAALRPDFIVLSVSIVREPKQEGYLELEGRQGCSREHFRKAVQFLEKAAVALMFCELLCNVIPAHRILAASSVSCCHFLRRRPRHAVTLLPP